MERAEKKKRKGIEAREGYLATVQRLGRGLKGSGMKGESVGEGES